MTIATLYLKTHNKTGLKYLGITIKNPYKYTGSGVEWLEHIKEHGRHDVTTEVLYEEKLPDGHKTSLTLKEICVGYSHSLNIVEDKGYANAMIESGVIGAKGNLGPTKYDWVGENKFNEYNESVDTNYEEDALSKESEKLKDYHYISEITPEDNLSWKDVKKKVRDVLLTLTAREERVLRKRFGIDLKEDCTLDVLSKEFGFSVHGGETIRQIEAKALRKCKHPSRSRMLRSLIDNPKNGRFATLELVGQEFCVSRDRIGQIEIKSLKKLKVNHADLRNYIPI